MTQVAKTQNQQLVTIQPSDARITALDTIAKEAHLIAPNNETPFANAIATANGIVQLREALTPEIMDNIMKLQGTSLGFRTDKDRDGGYPVNVVRDCAIEATMRGLPMVGNNINIIGGRLYITKEGCEWLLAKMRGLKYMITPGIPKMVSAGAEAPVHIDWEYNGTKHSKDIVFPIRVNNGMGADAINGKCKRKAAAWLVSQISGMEIPDGEIEDNAYASPVSQPQRETRFNKKQPIDVTPPTEAEVQEQAVAESQPATQSAPQTAAETPYPRLAAELAKHPDCPVMVQDFIEWFASEKWPFNEESILLQFDSAVESCIGWKKNKGN